MVNYRQLLSGFDYTQKLKAETLVCTTLEVNRAWLIAHNDQSVAKPQLKQLEPQLMRLASGEPLAYILGEANFYGLQLQVNPNVLIPRPETEQLVATALALPMPKAARVIDLGSGSGAIACALAANRPSWNIDATDISLAALQVATANATRLKLAGQIRCMYGNWWQAVAARQYQLVICNPPYVAVGDPSLDPLVANHEPEIALFAKDQGLAAYREIFARIHYHATGGYLIVEHGYNQQQQLIRLAREYHLVAKRRLKDGNAIARCLVLKHA